MSRIAAIMEDYDAVVIPDSQQDYERLLRVKLHKILIRKMRDAGWQTAYAPGVKRVKMEYLNRRFGVRSSKALEYADLEQAITDLQNTAISPPPHQEFAVPSVQQYAIITRVGRYVIGAYYGNQSWHIKKIGEWITEYYKGVTDPETGLDMSFRKVHTPAQLTKQEAAYIIRRLEKVEYRLKVEKKI